MVQKVISVSVTVFFICCSILLYNFYSIHKMSDLLYNDRYLISINYDDDVATENIIKEIQKKSKQLDVNVSQYVFFDEKSLNIYDSNLSVDDKVKIKQGRFKESNEFSYVDNSSDRAKKKTGKFKFPDVDLHVKHYTFGQLENVGLGDSFYLYSSSKASIGKMIEFMKKYGDLSVVSSAIQVDNPIDYRLVSLVVVSGVFLIISMLYYVINKQYTLGIKRMFGYSKFAILFKEVSKMFYMPIISGLLVIAGFAIYLKFIGGLDYWGLFFLFQLLVVIIISALISLFSWSILSNTYNHLKILDVLKGKKPFKAFNVYIIVCKLFITGIFFLLVGLFLNQQEIYQQKLNNASYWSQAKDVYKINVSGQANLSDLKIERKYSDRVEALYELLKERKRAFLMNSMNYITIEDNPKNTVFVYNLNIKNGAPLYNPDASITIDENYLKVNPIKLEESGDLRSKLNKDENTLNILVPEKYKKEEEKIKKLYREDFYFKKIEVENKYNKVFHQQLNQTKLQDVHVNIIYVQNNQKYFTFTTSAGSNYDHHYIKDPVAIIYDGKIDRSFIGAYMTSSIYFFDKSKGEAYNNIAPYLNKTKARPYINMVSSVYKDVNQEINELKKSLNSLTFSIVCLMLLIFIVSVNYIRIYYIHNGYNLYLRYLFGYSTLQRHKTIILHIIWINILFTIFFGFYFGNAKIFLCGALIIIIELVLAFIAGAIFNIRSINKILKGGN